MLRPEHSVALDRTVGRTVYRLHRTVYQLSGGRVGHRLTVRWFLLLTTKGRRSGQPRVTPLMALPDGDRWIVVASNGGRDQMPHWFLNLSAEPRVRVQVGRRAFAATATVLSDAERADVWPRLVAYYAGWSHYESLTARRIPVVALVPS